MDGSACIVNTLLPPLSHQAAAVYQDASDTTTVKIQWKHANGTSLSEETVPFQSFTSMAWAPKRYIRMKPVGAAVCRLTLVARKTRFWHDGYDNRGFFDAIVFVPADHKAVFTTMDLRLGNVHVTDPGTRTVSIGNLGMFSSVMVTDLLLNQTEGAGNFSLSGTDVREVGVRVPVLTATRAWEWVRTSLLKPPPPPPQKVLRRSCQAMLRLPRDGRVATGHRRPVAQWSPVYAHVLDTLPLPYPHLPHCEGKNG